MKRFYASLIALLLLTGGFTSSINAQTKKGAADAKVKSGNELLSALPASDGVIAVDTERLLNEFLPRVLADNPAKLAEVNARLDQIKTRTGMDLRTFERLAVGIRYVNQTPDSLKVESVALARGRFNAPAMLAAGLATAKGKYTYREEKHAGKTIYVFNGDELFGKADRPQVSLDEETKKSNKSAEVFDDILQKVLNYKAGELGIVALDANTLALGQPERVRAAIDAGAGRGRVAPALVQLATRAPDAVLGFGTNVPANISKYVGLDAADELAKNLNSIRQFYGSLGATTGGFELRSYARAETAAQAQGVHDMLVGVRELGGFFVTNIKGDKGRIAKSALENLKISKTGTDVQLSLELAEVDVATLVRTF